ncbi:hypothetical protein QOT17_003363 [Balamuthia mandrillaris]
MGDWDTGLWDCDVGSCSCFFSSLFCSSSMLTFSCAFVATVLRAYCCSCCQVATQRAALEGRDSDAADVCGVCLCSLCCMTVVRGRVRERYSIDGSCLEDFLLSCLCFPCAIPQQERQLEREAPLLMKK